MDIEFPGVIVRSSVESDHFRHRNAVAHYENEIKMEKKGTPLMGMYELNFLVNKEKVMKVGLFDQIQMTDRNFILTVKSRGVSCNYRENQNRPDLETLELLQSSSSSPDLSCWGLWVQIQI
ncbi:hypothetical protein U1Q18_009692 [Sarracenia purpurea var. burkii]